MVKGNVTRRPQEDLKSASKSVLKLSYEGLKWV